MTILCQNTESYLEYDCNLKAILYVGQNKACILYAPESKAAASENMHRNGPRVQICLGVIDFRKKTQSKDSVS